MLIPIFKIRLFFIRHLQKWYNWPSKWLQGKLNFFLINLMCYIKFIICLGLTYFDGHIPLRAVHAQACPCFWEIGVLLLSVMAIHYILKIMYSHLHIYVYFKYVFITWAAISSYFIYVASKDTHECIIYVLVSIMS